MTLWHETRGVDEPAERAVHAPPAPSQDNQIIISDCPGLRTKARRVTIEHLNVDFKAMVFSLLRLCFFKFLNTKILVHQEHCGGGVEYMN
jgi:hypothetical protein